MTRPLRALIVEDRDDDCRLLVAELRRSGFDVVFLRVEREDDMRRALENEVWDIVFSDYSMPRFNGRAALELLQGTGRDIPFIMVSGTIGEESAVEAMKAGASDYFMKNNLARLGPAVERQIEDVRNRARRRETERELLDSERRLSLLLQSLPMALYTADLESLATNWVGPQVERICGFPPQRFTREPGFWESRLHPDDRRTALLAAEDRRRSGTQSVEYRWRCADGAYKWFLDNSVRLPEESGHTNQALGTWLDITERKKNEETLKRNDTMQALGALVAGVAHEVRNPLFAISATIDTFELKIADRPDLVAYGVRLRDQLDRLNALMNDLLDYGRPPAFSLREESFREILDETVAVCRPLADASRVQIVLPQPGDPLRASLDRGRVRQVLINLLQNAIQHSPPEGRVELDASLVREGGDDWIRCRVRDSGGGIRPEDLPKLFEPFFTRRRDGTGLGLAISRRIIEEHGGRVRAENTAGGGAVFTIFVPAAAEAPVPGRLAP